MATKDGLFLKKEMQKQFFVNNDSPTDNDNRNLNLNSNQISKCLNLSSSVHSFNKLNNNKKFDFSLSENDEKVNLHSWNKSTTLSGDYSNNSNFSNFYDGSERESKKEWNNKESSTKNTTTKSTLSLYIEAYENSVENDTVIFDGKRSEDLKEKKSERVFSDSTFVFQNPFEFPRQQENDKNKKPEIAQFKASQKLLSGNKVLTSNNGQHDCPQPSSTMSKKDDRRTSILKAAEENAPQQVVGDSNKTKRRVSFHTHRTVKEFDKAELGVDRTPKNESIHYSGSSEERSSFFGNRPGSALTYTSHQTTDIVVNDKNFTINSTANETIAMFNRVGNPESAAGDEDNTTSTDPTLAFIGHLQPLLTPNRNNSSHNIPFTTPTRNLEDQTLAFIEKFVPTEMLSPEVRASPKRIAEIYDELSRPVHISSPTSDKNPHVEDQAVTKAFETCTLSPVKHRQEAAGNGLNFDLDDGDHNMEQEEVLSEINQTPPFQEKSLSQTYQVTPVNSTYVVTAPSRDGMYLADESETNPTVAPINEKTFDVNHSNDEKSDVEMANNSGSFSAGSVVVPQHSEITKKKFRRLSDTINRQKRRSLIINAATSASNSPAIEEEKSHQLSSLNLVANAIEKLSSDKSATDKAANYSVDIYDEPMDTSQNEAGNASAKVGQDSVIENFEQDTQQHNYSRPTTLLLEDVQTPTKYFEDSNFTMPNQTAANDADNSSLQKPFEKDEPMAAIQKSAINESLISQKSVVNQTVDVEPATVASNLSFGLPSINKKLIKPEESPKVNQTPGWSKYSKCLEMMKKLGESVKPIIMEDFDEEPNYVHGDSVMHDPTTPKRLVSSMSYQQEYRDRNLEEPSEILFENDKENLSGNNSFAAAHNNSTLLKSSAALEHKSFQMSRLGCVERQFAPDKAFYIEKVIKDFYGFKSMAENLNIDLPGINDVVPEFLIYDEQLVITYYKLFIKVAIIDTQFGSLNGNQEAKEKRDNFKFLEEQLEKVEKSVNEVVDELKLTKFTMTKFLDKKTNYLVRLSSTNPEKFASIKKGVLEWNSKVDDLRALYARRMNEMNQEMKAQKDHELKATAGMNQKFADLIQRYENNLQNTLPGNR